MKKFLFRVNIRVSMSSGVFVVGRNFLQQSQAALISALCYVGSVYDPKADKKMRDEGDVVLSLANCISTWPETILTFMGVKRNRWFLGALS